jgi:hypothetical protein
MEQVRVYHLTLSTRGYSLGENAWSYEAHFTAALTGNIHNIREKLRAIAFPYFQRLVLERYGQHVPLDRIRGEFERKEQALGSPNVLSKKIGDGWMIQIEHRHNDLDRTGTFTFWYKIVSEPNKATFGCRLGFNDLI